MMSSVGELKKMGKNNQNQFQNILSEFEAIYHRREMEWESGIILTTKLNFTKIYMKIHEEYGN